MRIRFKGSMAVATLIDQLESVQAAITAIEGGVQSYRMGDETVTMASLGTLYTREKEIKKRLARQRQRKKLFMQINFPTGG